MRYAGTLATIVFFFLIAITLFWSPSLVAQTGAYVGLSQVTNDDFVDLYPNVSPDGRYVAYMSYQKNDVDENLDSYQKSVAGKNFDIFIKELASGNTTRLHSDRAWDAFPSYNFDGKALYFDAFRKVDMRAIWRKVIGGGTDLKVTNINRLAFGADCHPEKDVIVFNAHTKGDDISIKKNESFWKQWKKRMPGIFIINSDGSNMQDLNKEGLLPKFSPDGDRIVFANNQFGNYEIYTMNVDGSNLIRLTTREAEDIEPAWSPDGRFIVFASNENKNWNLWMMKPDGTGLAPVTTHKKTEAGPMWGADGYIYFHSNRNGEWDIWRLKPAGYEPTPPDKDGDGITNFKDKCPDQPEDIDGFQDEDGCPDPDNDNDGVLDKDDKCPDEIEDMDGFQDNDGCPDPDNDNDGLLDGDDQCPNDAESPNFYRDADGCPERSPVDKGDVLILSFGLGSTNIGGARNRAELLRVADAIKQMPKAKVILKVYTDSRSHRGNPRLTDHRAQKLMDYLLQLGVPRDQLSAVGMGDSEPVTSSTNTTGRKQNNRVVIDLAARN